MLACSLADAAAIAVLVAEALADLSVPLPALLGAVAGATVPLIGPLGHARLVAPARRAAAPESTVGAALSFKSTFDEISFVLGPALVGPAAVLAHPACAPAAAALPVALCGSGFALHPTARATRQGHPARSVPRSRMPRSVHAVRAAPDLWERCSEPVRRVSPRSPSGWDRKSRQVSCTPPWG
ncbi:hypothetical protein ACWDBW_08375 [Streptomyces sp. NPDC001107]